MPRFRFSLLKMKMPPLLMGATLLFWGWQTGFLFEGAVMALILESARLVKVRWEFSDDEFARVCTFCIVLFLAAMIFAFNSNGGPSDFGQLFQSLNSSSEHNASNASAMTADSLFRWLPMIFFLFVAAQTFSPAEGVPLEAFSFWMRTRRKRARKRGQPMPPSRRVNVLYPYFALCLFSAAAHSAQDNSFYYGLCILVSWALWPERSRRFALPVWLGVLTIAVVVGFFGQRGFGQLSRLAEEYDPQILSFLMHSLTDPKKSRTDIGDVGRVKMSGKIVIRLEPENGAHVPEYLREASYRKLSEFNYKSYKQLVWDSGNTNNDFPPVSETPPDSGNWSLYGDPANKDSVNIACYLDGINRDDKYPDGLLPLPTDCSRLENLHAYFVYRNTLGTVLAEGPRLMIFDAHFGSGLIKDDKPDANESMPDEDLFVPTNEIPALDQFISQLKISGRSDDQKILAVSQYFADNFKYSLWQDTPKIPSTNATALAQFLFDTRSGHCEYFATATVLLLREMGIPARYAVGYYVHESAGSGYVVRLRDAHAWCLAWNKQRQVWQNLDTTPSTWVKDEKEHSSPFQFLSDFQSWAQYEIIKFFDYSHNNIREYIFWALIPALAFLLYRIFRGSPRHHKDEEQLEHSAWPGLDSEFYRLEQKLAQSGLPRDPGEPLSVWVQRATKDSQFAKLKQSLENILVLHYRYRFDPQGLDASERQMLRSEVETCLSAASSEIR
jgi:protein-glutamine gamma-glutamyltransferase